jgi:hypothetical protein
MKLLLLLLVLNESLREFLVVGDFLRMLQLQVARRCTLRNLIIVDLVLDGKLGLVVRQLNLGAGQLFVQVSGALLALLGLGANIVRLGLFLGDAVKQLLLLSCQILKLILNIEQLTSVQLTFMIYLCQYILDSHIIARRFFSVHLSLPLALASSCGFSMYILVKKDMLN